MTDRIPVIEASSIPAVTREQMREVDRLMIEEYGVQLIQMMENAGLQLARLVRHLLGSAVQNGRVLVLAGRGNNGGGGLVAARRLAAWGSAVSVVLTDDPETFEGVPAHQLGILRRMALPLTQWNGDIPEHDIIVDALIGYGLRGAPRAVASELIAAANESTAPVVSLDVPSGMDVDMDVAPETVVRATATLTLALSKGGLLRPEARPYVGALYLADISVPPALYERVGLGSPQPFADGQLVKLTS